MEIKKKRKNFIRRKHRVRTQLSGTAKRPRLAVYRSLKHISCQLIDDQTDRTLCAASDRSVKVKGNKTEKAKAVGTAIAQAAKKVGITAVVFDRSGYKYHGRLQALAEAARSNGLQF